MRKPKKLIVEVYRNLLMKGVVWSIRIPSGIVIMHEPTVALRNVRFIVRKGGREQVLREQKKNVHAFAKGELMLDPSEFDRSDKRNHRATYNPYHSGSFMYDPQAEGEDLRSLYTSEHAVLSHVGDRPTLWIKGANNKCPNNVPITSH